jgi:hypothetical protein
MILGIVLWPAAIIAFLLGFSDWLKQRRFFSRAIAVEGRIVGALPAKQTAVSYSPNQATTLFGATGQKQAVDIGGVLLNIQYEVGDYICHTQSAQVFNELPSKVTVHYDPKDPSDVAINGYYLGKTMHYLMIASAVMVCIPFIYAAIF